MWPFTRKKKQAQKPELDKGIRQRDARRSSFIPSASRDYGGDLLNPLNPLSPVSPLNPINNYSGPDCSGGDSASQVHHTPYDSSPSCSYDSGSSSSYDSGGFSGSSD